jgi:hypothetical protein
MIWSPRELHDVGSNRKMKRNNKNFLFAGLSFLAVAFGVRFSGGGDAWFYTLLGIGILLKGIFLFNVFRERGFHLSLGLSLILAGIIMILTSLLFKNIFPVPLVRSVLFYGALVLKATGLTLLVLQRRTAPSEKAG